MANWVQLLFASLLSSLFFSLIAYIFAMLGVQVMGFSWQEFLVYPLLSFAGLLIYQFLNVAYTDNSLEKFTLSLSNLLLGICAAMLFFTYAKWFSVITFGILLLLLLYIEYFNKLRFMYRFYRTYLISLFLFYPAFALLIAKHIVEYDPSQTVNLNIGNIPLECYFFFIGMLLLSTYLLELFNSRKTR